MEIPLFIKCLSEVRLENVFNPYGEVCPMNDLPDAATKRSRSLEAILAAACSQEVSAIWIARDLGYLGGRRTGLALTGDLHYRQHLERWGVTIHDSPCRGKMVRERTANVVWGELAKLRVPIFLWNVFPFHPHEPGKSFSNRPHTKHEREIGLELLAHLLRLINPLQIVAIGNDAARATSKLSFCRPRSSVRHPSYGGANIFRRQISELLISS